MKKRETKDNKLKKRIKNMTKTITIPLTGRKRKKETVTNQMVETKVLKKFKGNTSIQEVEGNIIAILPPSELTWTAGLSRPVINVLDKDKKEYYRVTAIWPEKVVNDIWRIFAYAYRFARPNSSDQEIKDLSEALLYGEYHPLKTERDFSPEKLENYPIYKKSASYNFKSEARPKVIYKGVEVENNRVPHLSIGHIAVKVNVYKSKDNGLYSVVRLFQVIVTRMVEYNPVELQRIQVKKEQDLINNVGSLI